MIVTLGALEREAHHPTGQYLQLIINHLQAILHAVHRIGARAVRRHAQEAGRHQLLNHRFIHRLGIGVVHQFVTGNLLDQKPVIGLVRIKRVDHIIAIPPCVIAYHIRIAFALRIRIAGHVQPMPPPADAISRRCQ